MKKRTIQGDVELQDALDHERNMLVELRLPEYQDKFVHHLNEHHHVIAAAVARHLNAIHPSRCEILPIEAWILGSFNLCVPLRISDHPIQSVMMRFPLPYKIGEDYHPGNVDEKLCTEAATYIWLDENCPEVPIPRLLGYSYSNGQRYTALDNMPLATRLYESLRRLILKWTGQAIPSRYVSHGRTSFNTGYLLLEDVKSDGINTLHETWELHRNDATKRRNLIRDLSNIILAVGRETMPRIGSLTIDDHGYLGLNNRPLTVPLQQLENERIDSGIERSDTYTNAIAYAVDLLESHNEALRHQPNAVNDEDDGLLQMSTYACMQMVLPHFFPKSTRRGPFILRLTDIHQSNIFVDEEWHIRSLVDLEYAAFLPIEMELTPFWLDSQDLDGLSKDPDKFDTAHREFVAIFREQERRQFNGSRPRADAMQRAWEQKAFFYYHSLRMRIGCVNMFQRQILPLFKTEFVFKPSFAEQLMPLWSMDGEQILHQKTLDKKKYDLDLQQRFIAQD